MNWFRQNKFMGGFLVTVSIATLLSLFFLWHAKSAAETEQVRLDAAITELNRLRGSTPFPDAQNLSKMKAQTESYRVSLRALEDDLRRRMFPEPTLQPNEFQALLRQVSNSVSERARAAKVRLPENFKLGFDEYATSLPNPEAAPRLGGQLRAIEWMANTLVDAHVDSLENLARTPLPEETASSSESTPASPQARGSRSTKPAGSKMIDASSIQLGFTGSPASVRRVLNQVTNAPGQFYVIRTLQERNPADKGPKRGLAAEPVLVSSLSPAEGAPHPAGVTFIVGAEHVSVILKIEILRFHFTTQEAR
ncbi:MAG: Amuc_1100 family pilus-like protein [Chthoniobacterales bacterium]